MKAIEHEPFAPALIESMRAVGYSLESAIADVIDNSISASAHHIALRFSPHDDPYVAIVDDGDGMSAAELLAAMRHGSQDPNKVREAGDLGRFGLGLKTASLSQCRQLTVVTFDGQNLSAARWDLDVIAKTKKWTLLILNEQEVSQLPFVVDLERQGKGTIVLWRNLDRFSAAEESIELGLRDGMVRVQDHLGLVFHRFISDERSERRVGITVNQAPLTAIDPFLRWHRATYPLPGERVHVRETSVDIQPYILPHYSKLSPKELQLAGGEEGLRRQQGFYVYRAGRLIVWGTWFRLARQEELTKLARVQVDIPNTLDHLWTLDIKKSTAHPPAEVKENLRRIVSRISDSSRRVYEYRGRRANEDRSIHLWDRVEHRGGGIRYQINRDHPLVATMETRLDEGDSALLQSLIRGLEDLFPAEALYADMASDKRQVAQREGMSDEALADLAGRLLDACGPDREKKEALLANLSSLEPFSLYQDITSAIIARLRDGREREEN